MPPTERSYVYAALAVLGVGLAGFWAVRSDSLPNRRLAEQARLGKIAQAHILYFEDHGVEGKFSHMVDIVSYRGLLQSRTGFYGLFDRDRRSVCPVPDGMKYNGDQMALPSSEIPAVTVRDYDEAGVRFPFQGNFTCNAGSRNLEARAVKKWMAAAFLDGSARTRVGTGFPLDQDGWSE